MVYLSGVTYIGSPKSQRSEGHSVYPPVVVWVPTCWVDEVVDLKPDFSRQLTVALVDVNNLVCSGGYQISMEMYSIIEFFPNLQKKYVKNGKIGLNQLLIICIYYVCNHIYYSRQIGVSILF